MKKTIATFVIGLFLAFGVIGVSAHSDSRTPDVKLPAQNKMMKRHHRHHHKRHHRHHRKHK